MRALPIRCPIDRRNGMSILVLLLYSGYAVGKVAVRFLSSMIPQ
jgi:hypothetical protein